MFIEARGLFNDGQYHWISLQCLYVENPYSDDCTAIILARCIDKQKYDEEKMAKGSGISLIIIGIATAIDSYTTGLPAKIIYIVVLLAAIIWLILFIKNKCQKNN